MKNILKRIIAINLIFAFLFSYTILAENISYDSNADDKFDFIIPDGWFNDAVIKNILGELEWYVYENTLNIEGYGVIPDFNGIDELPWKSYRETIESVVISEGVTGIGKCAFIQLVNLTDVQIPGTVSYIGDSAFFSCHNLQNIDIPDSVTSIGVSAFAWCVSLRSITLPSGLKTIEHFTFTDCYELSVINLNNGLESIDNCAFNCAKITDIYIPKSISYIGDNVFNNCIYLENVYYDGTEDEWNLITFGIDNHGYFTSATKYFEGALSANICGENARWSLTDGVLRIYGTGDMYNYQWNNKAPWYECYESIDNVVIERGITSVGDFAFFYLVNVQEITMPEGITYIGENSFDMCNSIREIYIPASVNYIHELAFDVNYNLENINVSSDNAYYSSVDGNLYNYDKTVMIRYAIGKDDTIFIMDDKVVEIADYCFSRAETLKNIILGKNVKYIRYFSVSSCHSLTDISLPSGIVEIENDAFYKTLGIENVYFGGSETEWNLLKNSSNNYNLFEVANVYFDSEYSGQCGENVFYRMEYPATIIIYGTGAMYDNSDADDVPWVNYSQQIKKLIVESGVTSIGDNAFFEHEYLTDVNLGDTLKRIGESAFSLTSVQYLDLPDSLEVIDDYAFSNCKNLININFGDAPIVIGDFAFWFCDSLETVIIPYTESIGDYAFYDSAVTDFTVIKGLKEIGKSVFQYSAINNITLPSSLYTVYRNAFNNTTLTNVYYYGNRSSWNAINVERGNDNLLNANITFIDQNGLYEYVLNSEGNAVITGFNRGYIGELYIPSVIDGYTVTEISNNAFAECRGITYINIPNTVNKLYAYAFAGCSSVERISLSENIETIDGAVFHSCSSLKEIYIPDRTLLCANVMTGDPFLGCYSLENIYVSEYNENYVSIDGVLYSKDLKAIERVPTGKKIRAFIVPSGVECIGDGAFYDCCYLEEIILPDGVKKFEDISFWDNYRLKKIVIPKSLKHSGWYNEFPDSTVFYYEGSESEWMI